MCCVLGSVSGAVCFYFAGFSKRLYPSQPPARSVVILAAVSLRVTVHGICFCSMFSMTIRASFEFDNIMF